LRLARPLGKEVFSFLKKRNRKFYSVQMRGYGALTEQSKSFLVLFFKKERLPRVPADAG
jgi:uncharacterized protein with von Willebrand factor type A (vWA) domain